jgi:hypothetical protein
LFVRPSSAGHLEDIHDVAISSVANNQGLFYEASTDLWKNKSIATVLGYTPANDANVVHTTGSESISGVKAFTTAIHSNILKFSESGGFNQTAGFTQIGGTADYFNFVNGGNTKSAQFTYNGAGGVYTLPATSGTLALTSDLHNAVTIGTANGLSLSTQVLSLGLSSTSTTGALSSTDWNTFNGKQNALGYTAANDSEVVKLTGNQSIANQKTFTGFALFENGVYLKQGSGLSAISGYNLIDADTNGIYLSLSNLLNTAYLNLASLTEQRTFTFPNASGTIALTSNLSAYLPLSGGTLTGALSGTSATFTSGLIVSNTSDVYPEFKTSAIDADAFLGFSNTGDGNAAWSIGRRNTGEFWISTYTGNFNSGTRTQPLIIATSGAATFSSSVTAGDIFSTDGTRINFFGVGTGANVGYVGMTTNHSLAFLTNNTEKMRITSAGNVGIGTTAPVSALHVYANLSANPITFEGNGSSNAWVRWKAGASTSTWQLGASSGAFIFYDEYVDAERMRITSGGTLLVNQTSLSSAMAGAKMQVATDLLLTGSVAGVFFENRSGGVTSNSNWYGWYATSSTVYLYNGSANIASINTSSGAYTALSDINKKKDFEDSSIGLNAIMGLKPKLYRMKDQDESSSKQLGFIAQEVKDYIPQAYIQTKGEKEDFIGLDDRPIIATLVKAIQEQQAQIEELKNK